MENKALKELILEVLKQDKRLWNEEKTELNQTLLFDLLDKIDVKIIELLINEESLREKFFIKIKDVYVFKSNDFLVFMEENKIDNSYTKYINRIGLTDGKRFINDSNDVVLNFPYKDCVLEGGQSNEEGTNVYFEYSKKINKYEKKEANRREIFYNSVIAQDEIDRLYDAKALVNWKRFTQKGAQKVKEIKRDENGIIKENLIIKGNNLLALHSLKKELAGNVKLIYIDPPYNPPSKNNTFIYNNNFNHSTWLTFMKNRLDVGKKLLSDDGAFIVAIDENEVHYLGVLIRELFPEYEYHCMTIVHNPRGIQGTNFSYTHEYAFFIYQKGKKIIGNRKIEEENIDFRGLRDNGGESLRTDARTCFYPIIVDKCTNQVIDIGDVCDDDFHPDANIIINDFVYIYPIDKNGIERKWRYSQSSVKGVVDLLRVVKNKQGIYDIQIGKDFGTYRTVWIDKRYDANEYGTKIVNNLVKDNTFSFPKSLWNVYDCIYAVVGNDKNAIIIDYHAGSGTTAHAVLELNKDGGNRKFIMIEQMDYINTVTCPRVQKVMETENISNSFIYLELAKWNEKAKEHILKCNSIEELESYFDEMYETYFLNYNLKIKEFKEKVIKEKEFRGLYLEEQKRMFIAMLDNNQMYVNKTEMEDKKFGISIEDIELTKQFYNE